MFNVFVFQAGSFLWDNILAIFLLLDTTIYNFIGYLYEIFSALAKVNIFSTSDYQTIVRNIYAILGIIMLFVLAYSLLRAVINPDEFAKGETSFPKFIKNVVVSLAIIAFLPAVFTIAFNFQNAVLNQNTIPKLIFGTGEDYDGTSSENAGKEMAYYVLSAFLHPNIDWCDNEGLSIENGASENDEAGGVVSDINLSECASKITGDGWSYFDNGESFASTTQKFLNGLDSDNSSAVYTNLDPFNRFGEAASEGELTYYFIISTIAGAFIVYVLLNFCFDMAVRVVKLMFFQIIAPIPVICRVIPGGKLKDVFSDWTKKTISTYIDVFIRIAVMYLGVYMIKLIISNFGSANLGPLSWTQLLIAKALLIMGVVIFIRQAPKLIAEMFHLDFGGMKLGLQDKLAMGGAFVAGGAAMSGLGTMGRNIVTAGKNVRNARGPGGKISALGAGVASAGAGLFSGAARGGFGARNAKNGKDMRKASGDAVAAASAAKAKRGAKWDSYKANNPDSTFANTLFGVVGGDIMGRVESAGEYFGFGSSLDALKEEKEVADTMQGFYKTMAGYVADNEKVMSYQSLYDAEMKREIPNSVTKFDQQGYNRAIDAQVSALRNSGNYRGVTTDRLRALAMANVDKSQFTTTTTLSAGERQAAIAEKQANLKMYDQLKKLATIQAINEKLNDVDGNGKIVDGRFAKVANEVEVFKKQNASYDFVKNMSDIGGVNWDNAWTDTMMSGDANAVDALMKEFKNGNVGPSFFSDSEKAKNHSSDVGAEIGKKIQEKQKKSDN